MADDVKMHSEGMTSAANGSNNPMRAALTGIQHAARTSRTPSPTPGGTTATSSFAVSLMPQTIHPRTLHSSSVHYSTQTGRWVATIARVLEGEHQYTDSSSKKCIQTFFPSEREARKFAKAFSPPKLTSSTTCGICNSAFNHRLRPQHNCRNCGCAICDKCSTRWGIKQIPKTYVLNSLALTVRVCKSCDWLSNAFCMALLQGKYEDAVTLYATCNVNLRSSFAGINQEAMFPVHCAVLGGNVETLKWLVDKHCCPISIRQDGRNHANAGGGGGRCLQSVQTSAGRSLIDLAMTGKPKLKVLRYLVMEQNLSVMDTKDPTLAPRTLEALLRAGVSRESAEASVSGGEVMVHIIDDHTDHSGGETLDDACILCYERSMDCVLIPCGHQVCCQECGRNLNICPVCKVNCSVLRVFRHG